MCICFYLAVLDLRSCSVFPLVAESMGFWLQCLLLLQSSGSRACGLRGCGSQALTDRLRGCGKWACGLVAIGPSWTRDQAVSSELAGGILATGPLGSPGV